MAKKNRDQREERLEKSSAKSASVVVPVTLHKGQPIGVQLIAGRYREDLALDAAAAIEKRAGILVPRLWEKMGLSGSRPSFARLIDKGVTSWDLSVERLSRHSSAVALGSATFGHR